MEGDGVKNFDAQLGSSRNFSDFDVVTVMFGVNDYMNSKHTLDEVKVKLTGQLTTLKSKVAHGKIYGILPLQSYRTPLPTFWSKLSAQTTRNAYGYSMNEMMDMEKSVFESLDIPVLDWRNHEFVTDSNYDYWLPNDALHPGQKGYIRMGQVITNFIKDN